MGVFVGKGSLAAEIGRISGGAVTEVLLGNPAHQDRRLIAFVEREGRDQVAKVACDGPARKALAHEVLMLAGMSQEGQSGCPKLLWEGGDDSYRAFLVDYYEGEWKWNARGLRKLLLGWVREVGVPLKSFEQWVGIARVFGESGVPGELIGKIAARNCASSLVHGDLAPWNVMTDEAGKPIVVDWESGVMGGIAGLDLVHWFFQLEFYVHKRSALEGADRVLERLRGREYGEFLDVIGWGGHVEHLVAVHFASGWLVPEEFRGDLVRQTLGL